MNIIPSYDLSWDTLLAKVDNSSETIVNSLFIGVTKIETHLNLTIRDFASLNVGWWEMKGKSVLQVPHNH